MIDIGVNFSNIGSNCIYKTFEQEVGKININVSGGYMESIGHIPIYWWLPLRFHLNLYDYTGIFNVNVEYWKSDDESSKLDEKWLEWTMKNLGKKFMVK